MGNVSSNAMDNSILLKLSFKESFLPARITKRIANGWQTYGKKGIAKGFQKDKSPNLLSLYHPFAICLLSVCYPFEIPSFCLSGKAIE